jgi:WD40 repeat protein
VLLIDTASGSVVHKIPTSGQVYSVTYSPDGRTLAVAGTDTTVQVYDAASGALTRTLRGLSAPASVIAFSPDGTKLATKPFGPGALWLFNMATGSGQSVGDINVLGEVLVGSIAFTADGRALVVGSTLPYVAVLDSTTGTVVRRLPLSGGPFGCSPSVVGLGATGTLVVASNPCDGGGTITVWTGAAWTSQYTLTNVGNIGVTSLVVSHDGSRLAIGEYNGTASVWSLTSRTKLVPIVGIPTPITDVAFNPAGTEVVTASNDGISRVWRVGGPELLDLTSQVQVVEGLGLQADRLVATGLDGNQIVALVWSIPDGKLRSRFVVERSPSDGALVSADGKFVVGLDPIQSGDVTIWDVAGQRILRTINEPGTVLAAWSPDDRHVALVSGGPRSAPVVLDVASGKTVDMAGPIPSCYSNDATYPAFSGNGSLLAFSTFCGQVTVWDTATGKQVATFDDRAEASSLAFSPDGSRIAVGSWDGNLTVWQVQTSKAVLSVVADVQAVERGGVAYSADGHWIVTTHGDGTARVWDARTAHLLRIDTHPGTAGWVAFGPGDKTLATTDDQGVIRLWDACSACGDAKALLALAQQRTVQHPTPLESAILTGRD